MSKPVVVGIDGSPGANDAIHYGAQLASRLRVPLVLLHVYESVFYGYGPLSVAANYAMADQQIREAAEKVLAETLTATQAAYAEVKMISEMREGHPAAILIARSEDSAAIVVGARGVGGFADMLLGSVATQVAAHADGPVIVVRQATDPAGPIMVAYDGSPGAEAALSYGIKEALAQRLPLVVTNVYWEEPWGFSHAPDGDPAELAEHKAEKLIADALELVREEHPELQVETRTVHSMGPEYSLVEESERVSLMVVGCRGRGGFAGLLLGSVSRTVVAHAHSPVAVIHHNEH